MILVSHQHRFALVTIPKNACETFRFWFDHLERGVPLTAKGSDDARDIDIHKLCRRLYAGRPIGDDYGHFAVLRNPWTRVASAYFDLIVKRGWYGGVKIGQIGDFITFLETQDVEAALCDQHWRAQHTFIGMLPIHHYLKVENLQADFDGMTKSLGLPNQELPNWKKSKARSAKYRGLYCPREAERIGVLYRRDAELGGYNCLTEMIDSAKTSTSPSSAWITRARLYLGLRMLWHKTGVPRARERLRGG